MGKPIIVAYYLVVTVLLAIADSRGWILSGLGRGGVGRSYSSYNHK